MSEHSVSASPRRWRALDDSHLIWRRWEEGTPTDSEPLSVVYCLDSDDTHLMNDLGAAVIQCLQKEVLTLEELLDRLAADYLPSPELRSVIPSVLIERFLQSMTLSGMIFEEN